MTFVLVHGAFHGSWCWRVVSDILRDGGHRVYTPTLTGLGERSHLSGVNVDLETHIADVVNLIECEELQDIVLVGHSYASYVITGVCDRIADRVRILFYLDSFVPAPGSSFLSNIPEKQVAAVKRNLMDGNLVPPFPPEFFGIEQADAKNWAWLNRRLTPQPLATFTQELQLAGATVNLPKVYVRCTEYMRPQDDPVFEQIQNDEQWQYLRLESVHDAMIANPQELAALLQKIGG